MADFVLTLGGVEFRDFEIPESIRAGGEQMLSVHKYAGGNRTVDAFGPDDDAIDWGGTFFDQDAESRCQQLDAMRRLGQQVELSWSSFSYLVVIKSFKFTFERFYQIKYSLQLEVVADNTQPGSSDDDDPETDIQGDVSDAAGFVTSLASGIDEIASSLIAQASGLVDGVEAIASSVADMGSVIGAPLASLGTLSIQISDAVGEADDILGAIDVVMDDVGAAANFVSGMAPTQVTENLNSLVVTAAKLPTALALSNTLGRLAKEVSNITG